jgi:hypothetical protein
MVDVGNTGQFKHRQSVVIIRNAMVVDAEEDREPIQYHNDRDADSEDHDDRDADSEDHDDWDAGTHLIGALNNITVHNEVLRRQLSKGRAKAKGGDIGGTIHAIGTLVAMDRVGTLPYAANGYVLEGLQRRMVVSLSRIGCHCFPQVYAVIRDLKSDSCILPVPPMDGPAGCCVGYTAVDMSVNLGNSLHYNVHNASQGYSVWTEEIRGLGANWYFVMPNLHGMRPDGRPFAGIAIRLGYGFAISWDGRVIRHSTSLSMPDGIAGKRAGGGKKCFKNHLYETFTTAKRRLCRPEDVGLTLQWRVNPFPLPSPWTLMICPALVMEYLHPKDGGTAAGRRGGGGGGTVLLPMLPMSGMLVVRRVWKSWLCPIMSRHRKLMECALSCGRCCFTIRWLV